MVGRSDLQIPYLAIGKVFLAIKTRFIPGGKYNPGEEKGISKDIWRHHPSKQGKLGKIGKGELWSHHWVS